MYAFSIAHYGSMLTAWVTGIRLFRSAFRDDVLMILLTVSVGMILTITSMVGAFYWGSQRGEHIPFSDLWLKYGTSEVDPELLAEATDKAQSIVRMTDYVITHGPY